MRLIKNNLKELVVEIQDKNIIKLDSNFKCLTNEKTNTNAIEDRQSNFYKIIFCYNNNKYLVEKIIFKMFNYSKIANNITVDMKMKSAFNTSKSLDNLNQNENINNDNDDNEENFIFYIQVQLQYINIIGKLDTKSKFELFHN